VVTICTASLTFTILRSAHTAVFMCFVWISEQTAIISLYNINWPVFITETECVYCAVRTGTYNVIHASFPLPFHDFSLHFRNKDHRLRSTGTCGLVDGYRRFGRTCFLQFKVKERHQRLEEVAPSRRWCLSFLPDCTSYLKALCLFFQNAANRVRCYIYMYVYMYICMYSICTVQSVSGATRLAGRMRLSRHSRSAG
jgi:hypothetical protein